MKILHTVQFYSPSVGGVQEVVRQISEQLVERDHTVTVATSFHPQRRSFEQNGVRIEQFKISGNAVRGYRGEVKRYQDFLRDGRFDVMMNYAAQQWASDLVFPELDLIPYKKVLVPCGFSALYDPAYASYFGRMSYVMEKYDQLIFHAEHYRDTDFARQNGLASPTVIPNGALQAEFDNPDPTFRERYHIPSDVPLLVTVGTHTGLKGHKLVLEAFRRLKTARATLIIIGNAAGAPGLWQSTFRPLLGAIKRLDGAHVSDSLHQSMKGGSNTGCLPDCRANAREINHRLGPGKHVLLLDPPRPDVVAALHAADLFIFGSNIEYSPIVLFEAMASGTPFLTLSCGNAAEIVEWSKGGGVMAPTTQTARGFVDGDPAIFATLVDDLLSDPDRLRAMSNSGYAAWKEKFTWERIAAQYEGAYRTLLSRE